MTDEQIIDIILKGLHERASDHGTPVKHLILNPAKISIDKNRYARIIKILIEDGIAERAEEDSIGGDDDLIISRDGIDIIKKYSSYSAWRKKNMKNDLEEIELMDKVFNYYIAYEIDHSERNNPNASLFAKKFNIDEDFSQHVINEVARIGNDLEILTAQKLGYGSYVIVNMNKFKSYKFRDLGGFKKYFSSDDSVNSYKNIHFHGANHGTIINAGDKSNFSNFTQDNRNKISIDRQKSTVINSLLKNIILPIIVGLIIAYLIFIFKWN